MDAELFPPTAKYEESDAVLSDDGKYRYLLRRTWDHTKPRMLYVMLNPSTADASIDDPTIKSCVRLAKAQGYGSFEVVNLFGLRATDPKELLKAPDPAGPDNDRIVAAAVGRCDVVVCAWGAFQFAHERAKVLRNELRSGKPAIYCLGKTKSGAPKHPLYMKSGTPLQTFDC